MSPDKITEDYKTFASHYAELQQEVFDFASAQVEVNSSVIHIEAVKQRPSKKIKALQSILDNLSLPDKYIGLTKLSDIKDIAGIRIVCNCEDDVENMAILLEGELRQKFADVNRVDKNTTPYHAIHLYVAKEVVNDGKTTKLLCEIQIRTVMADAWAIQDHKYVYGDQSEGANSELTNAVSEIMKGCEKLWSLVKRNSTSADQKNIQKEIEQIKKSAAASLGTSKTLKDDTQLQRWFSDNFTKAYVGLKAAEISTFLEVKFIPPDIGLDITKNDLRDAARNSTIKTFGWPIGIFMENKREFIPKVTPEGIYAEISTGGGNSFDTRVSYDYWAINSNGGFYLLKSLFENERKPKEIFFNTRIVRITEVMLYLRNLYTAFNVPINAKIQIELRHSGLRGKALTSSSPNRSLFGDYITDTDEVCTNITITLSDIDHNIVDVVEKFTKPLFEQFDFFSLQKNVLEEIVTNFVKGKIV